MSATLLFHHQGWTVAVSSWSAAASNSGGNVSICYPWTPLSGFGLFENSTGVERTTLKVTMTEFLERVRGGGLVDFRDLDPQ